MAPMLSVSCRVAISLALGPAEPLSHGHAEPPSVRAPHSIAPPPSAGRSPQEPRAQGKARHADRREEHRFARRAEKPADERPEEGRAVHADAIEAGGPGEPRHGS